MRLRAEIASLDNEIRSTEQESTATIWSYLYLFLPRRAVESEEQRQEQDPTYRGKIMTRYIKDMEKIQEIVEVKTCQTITSSYRQHVFSIESEIRRREEKELKKYRKLVKLMAEQRESEREARPH